MPKLTIDGKEIEVDAGMTVLQACEKLGIEVPRFCYHERLSIAGNCRMCLVDMERAPKPVASCAMPVADGMVIHTNTPKVQKMRQAVMEFTLINHPLDCPVCDQGGECDLQDQALGYGIDKGRFQEGKRAVKDKDIGPLVKMEMTRCIHCTRCIRFGNEIAGTPLLGGTFRSEHLEIGPYVEATMGSEMSGNLVDICPVGALTNKPYAFRARPWELKKTESVDVMDATGANIRIDTRGQEVMRVMPRLNEDVNEEWLADRPRYAIDGLKRQRLDQPYVRVNGKLQPSNWDEALQLVADKMNEAGSKVAALAGDLVDVESVVALKDLMGTLGATSMDCRQDGAKYDPNVRASYLFNSTIAGIEKADVILLVGTNPKVEAPVINSRIRKRRLQGHITIASVGPDVELTYKCENLGAGPDSLDRLANGQDDFAEVLKKAEHPMMIVGQGALAREDGAAVLAACKKIADTCGLVKDGWNGFNVLHTAGGRVGALEAGFVPGEGGKDTAGILAGAASGDFKVVYLLGADEIDTTQLEKAFVVYQGHHGDAGAHVADVILPGAAYTEKDATYLNTEGRVQRGQAAILPPGDAKADWAIIRALAGVMGKNIGYDSLEGVRARMVDINPVFMKVDQVSAADWADFGTAGSMDNSPFVSPVTNYYMTDAISRASETMAQCTALYGGQEQGKTGTDG